MRCDWIVTGIVLSVVSPSPVLAQDETSPRPERARVAFAGALPRLDGSRLKATIEAAGKAIDRFGTPGLREVLNFTGAGNHPEVVRFFARIGRAISEDQPVPAGRVRMARSAAEMMFPTMQKEE